MILVGNQRGGAQDLARHLMSPENEHVHVHEISGFASDTLPGAFNEVQAISRGTRCRQFLFSLSLNPPEGKAVSDEQFEQAVTKAETRLGLTGQPRAIVFHEKEGRRHCHAVWSRIDAEEMKAIQLSYSKSKLQEVSRELYREHGWQMPRGLIERGNADPRNFTLDQWQQAKRMGKHAGDLKHVLQDCWAISDSRASFEAALQDHGLKLAKGDRRGFVAVSYGGEALSLSRYIGEKAELEARLGKPQELPSVDQAKQTMAREMTPVAQGWLREADERSKKRMEPLIAQKTKVTEKHRAERASLQSQQDDRAKREVLERAAKLRSGFFGLWDRVTGKRSKIVQENERQAEAAMQRDRKERTDMIARQLFQRHALQVPIKMERRKHLKEVTEVHRELARYRREGKEPQREQEKPPEKRAPREVFNDQADKRREYLARLREPRQRPQVRSSRDRGHGLER
ncbi:relaxase/mobilization nuclease domain-containing protein [Parvularcula flava]|uniref:Relaxase/mobilization nuclease domain-containing protein n=1 Tax=Aquisalinus luteolus TaxID=1566827 RepID=A0A8J3A1W8_9PROT|nr:relaxase/mobilization nuclease domain-containing protein [Aquisalinus luteolus]NHK27926.1 relaxase/mobilization nuclease domain-containing protein [Aquisalinus luteolus]GGH96945.1 hypothetical protein GCM10011355_16970 [Aquisalinus luteolus]